MVSLSNDSYNNIYPHLFIIITIYIPFGIIITEMFMYLLHGILSLFVDENVIIAQHNLNDEFLNVVYIYE